MWPGNMDCFRYVIVNTLYKCDNRDDDNNNTNNNKVRTRGTITKSFTKYLNNVPGKHEFKKL